VVAIALKRFVLSIILWAPCALLWAADSPSCEGDCVAVDEWRLDLAVGLGMRSNPILDLKDTPLVLLPEVSYYGQRFFLRNLDLGFALVETERHQVNWVMVPSYDQMYFNEWDPLNFSDSTISLSGYSSAVSTPVPPSRYSFNILSNPPNNSDNKGISAPAMDSELLISGEATEFSINGQSVNLQGGTQTILGAQGQDIVFEVKNGQVNVWGLSPKDQLRLTGASVPQSGQLPTTGVGSVPGQPGREVVKLTGEVALSVFDSHVVTQGLPNLAPNNASGSSMTSQLSKQALATRRMAGLMGLEYHYYGTHLSLHWQVLQDITGVHDGAEMRMAAALPWQWQKNRWAVTLGANYKAQSILNYYYGVGPRDAVPKEWYFESDQADLETKIRLDWWRPLNARWTLKASAQMTWLPSAVRQSPLLNSAQVGSVFIGGIYHF
jgi:outer membrane scaffolding protein for murein synthesis (MipA/OmpV family)